MDREESGQNMWIHSLPGSLWWIDLYVFDCFERKKSFIENKANLVRYLESFYRRNLPLPSPLPPS